MDVVCLTKKMLFSIYILFSILIGLKARSKLLMAIFFIAIPFAFISFDLIKNRLFKLKEYKLNKTQIFYVFLLLIANIWIFYCTFNRFSTQSYSGTIRYIGAFLFLLLSGIILYGIIILKSKINNLFFILCFSIGSYMMFFLPVRMVPDENTHIYTAYRESEILLGNANFADNKILMRKTDREMFEDPIEVQFDAKMIEDYYGKMDFTPSTEYISSFSEELVVKNNDIAYWLPAIGLTIGKLMGLNGFYTLLLGRLFNLILYVTLCYWAVKLMPFNKLLPCTISLLPIALQQGMSYSYDALIISSSLFVVCGTLKLYFDEYLNRKKNIILSLFIILFSIPLIVLKSHAYFMVGMIPEVFYLHKKYSLNRYVKPILILLLCGICLYILIAFCLKFAGISKLVVEPTNPIAWADNEQGYTIQYFINHPLDLMIILGKSIISQFQYYLRSGTCSYLGWLNIIVTDKYVYAFTILMFISSVKQTDCINNIEIDNAMKVTYGLTFLLTSIGVILGLVLAWTPLSSSVVLGVQGRYFIPVYVTLFLLIRNNKFVFNRDHSHLILILDLFMMILFFTSLMVRF